MNQREDLITGTDGMADPGSETGSKAANALTAGALAAEGMVTRRGAKERDREDADQRASAAASVQDARDALGSHEPPAKSGDDPATGPEVVAELEADRQGSGHSEGQGSAAHASTTSQPDASPEARPAKVSVREWLRAAHAPQSEETKTVMARAEQELRVSEPELMRRFDQVQAQGQPARDAMTSALGSTRSAGNHTGTQEPSSHPSVVMDQHRPTRTPAAGSAATKTGKKAKRAKAAMSGSRR